MDKMPKDFTIAILGTQFLNPSQDPDYELNLSIVQTFNSCTSLPDCCRYLVDNRLTCQKKELYSTSMTCVACESKLRSVAR